MTARQVWEGVQIEMNKTQAPSLLLEDFNYLFNKAINQYVNKRYNIYDTNQQTTDDVKVLKSSATIKVAPKKVALSNAVTSLDAFLNDAKYVFNLPQDYLHLLSCSCIYKVHKRFKCYDANTYWKVGATRLTADLAPLILNNFYMRPSYKKPYYYITNVNAETDWFDSQLTPTNPTEWDTDVEDKSVGNGKDTLVDGTDMHGVSKLQYDANRKPQDISVSEDIGDKLNVLNQNLPRFRRDVFGDYDDMVERIAGHRYGNASNVRLEIRYGRDNTIFELVAIQVDYLKAPQHIRLTQEQIDLTEDTSQMMEFPDYVCQEIINELVHIVMENSSDPRINTHPVVTQSIASPAQEQTQTKK